MNALAYQITSLAIVYSTVYLDADQRKHQSSAGPVNSPHKGPVTRKMFPFDDVIILSFIYLPPARACLQPLSLNSLTHSLNTSSLGSVDTYQIVRFEISNMNAICNREIKWTQGLKCDHQIWPWPWPWPWIFKVKYGISYISAKSDPIATKQKVNISIEPQASNVTNVFDLDHNLDLWIWRSNVTFTFDSTHDLDHGFSWSNFEIAVSQNGRADWHCKGSGSRSFMTMTIWWPRSGVWIYQIVTGVTSVVGVPSTRLVI